MLLPRILNNCSSNFKDNCAKHGRILNFVAELVLFEVVI